MIKNKMPYLRNRAAFFCAVFILFFFFGISAAADSAVPVFAVLNLAFGTGCIIYGIKRRSFVRTLGIAFVVSVFGLLWALFAKYVYFYPSQRFLEKYEGKECGLVLRIDKTDSEGDSYGNYNCSIIMCDGEYTEKIFGVRPSLRLTCFGNDFADNGDMVYLKCGIQRPENVTYSGFKESSYLKARHIFMISEYNGELLLLREGKDSVVDNIRGRLSQNISRYVGDVGSDSAAISKCMLFGDKSGVSTELKEVFKVAGISHVLSVSGLHLSILFMTVSVFFGLRRRSVRRRFVFAETVSCILILMYMVLADFTPSIMRAGFMLIFMNLYSAAMYYKRKIGRQSASLETDISENISAQIGYYDIKHGRNNGFFFDSVSSLFCAGGLITILSPYSVFDVGMQLSFMSTLGILVAVYIFDGYTDRIKNKIVRAVAISFLITYSAVSFTLPIVIFNFSAVSTLGAVGNLIVTPLMTPLLAMLLVLAMLSLLPQSAVVLAICSFLGNIAEVMCDIAIWCARKISALPFASVAAPESKLVVVLFIILLAGAVTCLFFGKRRICMAAYFAMVMLYLVYMHIVLLLAVYDFNTVKVNLCTVSKHPYFCVLAGDDRIFFHDCSDIASSSIIEKSLGSELYGKDVYYLAVPCADADFDSLYFNITYLDRNKKIKKVLLPSADISKAVGMDMHDYAQVIRRIDEYGLEYAFYGEDFSVSATDFSVSTRDDAVGYVFGDTSVIFAEHYDEAFADIVSDGTERCVFFCDNAARTENKGYDSGAKLYVSSPEHKDIIGAQSIPTRKPVRLSP